jgi:hypothetical protein
MTKDEKMYILRSYKSLTIKSDWDQLAEDVYKSRKDALSKEMVQHYQDIYIEKKLKYRIKSFIHNASFRLL